MSNLFPQTWVGFDNLFEEIQRINDRTVKAITYPPYNVRKLDDNHYAIELAVAGFGKSDIEITTKDDKLVIKGNVGKTANDYIYKGIGLRPFEHSFTLADSVIVQNASMVNGLLKVFLEQFIPELKKPRKVEINDADVSELKTVTDTKQLLTE